LGQFDSGIELPEQRATIASLTRSLTSRERNVVRLRFEQDLTQTEIGEIVGVCQIQVSRICATRSPSCTSPRARLRGRSLPEHRRLSETTSCRARRGTREPRPRD
jgi:hypothetical protein